MRKIIITLFFASIALPLISNAEIVQNSPLRNGQMRRSPAVNAGKTDCREKIPPATRQFIFDYFHSIAHTNPKVATANVTRFSKMIGKIFKESSGNPTAYSDMKGNGSNNAVTVFYRSGQKASIQMYENLRANKSVSRTHQTNIGLLQISADQLYWRPHVRGLFNETTELFNKDPKAGLKMCGTMTMFKDSEAKLLEKFNSFRNCKVHNKKKIVGKKTVPVLSDDEFSCFDQWVSFCPSLNIGIGLKLPHAYFETSGAPPLCVAELKLILATPRLDINAMMRETLCKKDMCI